MGSEVSRAVGSNHRPSWSYRGKGGVWTDYSQANLEMMESCRNAMEDVRAELKQLNALFRCHNFLSIPPSLRKIARNTEKKPRVKKVTPA